MADSLSNAAPVGGVGGFPDRTRDWTRRQSPGDQSQPEREPGKDEVSLHGAAQIARRLVQSRVLARTRQQLELADGEMVPSFAEVVDAEPLAAFVGRLIGAQNQLAALRVARWPHHEVRRRLDAGLREGVEDTLELLTEDQQHGAEAAEVVASVLAEYAALLARLLT